MTTPWASTQPQIPEANSYCSNPSWQPMNKKTCPWARDCNKHNSNPTMQEGNSLEMIGTALRLQVTKKRGTMT